MTYVTLRSYGYFSNLQFEKELRNYFFKLCQHLHFFSPKNQGNLGVDILWLGGFHGNLYSEYFLSTGHLSINQRLALSVFEGCSSLIIQVVVVVIAAWLELISL